jgi:hypothetical protein
MTITTVGGPAGWLGGELADSPVWRYRLDARRRAELLAAVEQPGFPLPTLGPVLRDIARDVFDGRGFALIEGVPVAELSEHDREVAAAGLGGYLGSVVPQGDRAVVHVRDTGTDPAAPTSRGAEHRGRLGYHADPTDAVALLCVRAAHSGGLSSIVSAVAVHDELVRTRPDLAEVLYRPWWRDDRAGKAYQRPVYERAPDGRWLASYGPDYILSAQRIPGVPPLQPDQLAAMAELDRLNDDPRFALTMALRPGDVQILDNHVVLHSRGEYTDHAQPHRRRDLIRVWLAQAGRQM